MPILNSSLYTPLLPELPASRSERPKVSYTSTELDDILISVNDNRNFAVAINLLSRLDVHRDSTPFRTPTKQSGSSSPPLMLAHPTSQNTAYGQLVTLDKIVDKLIDKDLTDISDLFNRIRGCLKIHENCEHAFYSTFETFPFAVFSFFKTRTSERNHVSTLNGKVLIQQNDVRKDILKKIDSKLNPQ